MCVQKVIRSESGAKRWRGEQRSCAVALADSLQLGPGTTQATELKQAPSERIEKGNAIALKTRCLRAPSES